ncbi:SUKH-4 family immunity protein [Actinomadura alba]|uniref:SUKH-4 family immunity protein n=1 Tax=Actinomadura alba TaxID=406431 RepID=A0ABR7M2Q0_9ACTN|nr:SUKH-4 family immunity protein [Actinomadura alba]
MSNMLRSREAPVRFFYYFTAADNLLLIAADSVGDCLRFGFTRDGNMVCVSAVDSSVWEVPVNETGGESLINSSIDSFLEIMAICEDLISRHERADDEGELGEEHIERWIETSESICRRIEEIDPSSLFAGSYWSDFLSDVANGDYE